MSQTLQQKTDFYKKIYAYFNSLPFDVKGKTLCVCLSGGADSVALLCSLNDIKDKYGFYVFACHFNHQIRGVEADRDEDFCKSLCKSLGIKIYCGRDDVPAYAHLYGLSVEEAARECRYSFFERIYTKSTVDFCATAHNMNDDAETLIYNLIRGSGSNGASAIAPYNRNILRPFLKITREEIEQYLSDIKQDYVTDSTNNEDAYTRNYIRHNIVPVMKAINPRVIESLSRYIDSCRNDRLYFESIVNDNLCSDLRVLSKSIRDRVIIKKYLDVAGKHLNCTLVNTIDDAIFSHKRHIISVSNLYDCIVEDGNVRFINKTEPINIDFETQLLDKECNKVFNERVEIFINKNNQDNTLKINKLSISNKIYCDNIVGKLQVRNRRTGDKICIRGINKSLKKLFIDKKIPKEYRNIIPVISDNVGIIYVPFVGISDRVFRPNGQAITITSVFNTIDKERWSIDNEK